ncbi:MAG: hypothetical protein KDI16_12775 [Halioglobus sp.]|nr:hypothetical protein [Halioglobus sp.]
MNRVIPATLQRGLVLPVCLLVLLAFAALSSTVAGNSLLQLRMAGNEQARLVALQSALAVVDAVLAQPQNIPLDGPVGQRICARGAPGGDCDRRLLEVAARILPRGARAAYHVTRMSPLTAALPVLPEAAVSSSVAYRAAKFEVFAACDGIDSGSARAAVTQGVLLRLTAAAR